MNRSIVVLVCMVGGVSGLAAYGADDGWPLAVRLASYGKFEDAAWTHLPAIGVGHVFLSVPAAADVDAVMAKLKDAKIQPLVIRGNTDLSQESSVDELAGQLAICRKMGVNYMFLSAKRNGADKAVVYERLRKAGDAAKALGITIVLETHPDLGTNGDVHLETMKAINHPNVRVNFDTGNITYYNKDTDALAELRKVIDYVATVEFKDHSAELETWNFPVLGTGKVDFPGIVALLKEHGFRGPVTIEFEGIKGVALDEAQTKSAIADSVQYVKSLAAFK